MKEKICEINKKAKLTKIVIEIKNESWSVSILIILTNKLEFLKNGKNITIHKNKFED